MAAGLIEMIPYILEDMANPMKVISAPAAAAFSYGDPAMVLEMFKTRPGKFLAGLNDPAQLGAFRKLPSHVHSALRQFTPTHIRSSTNFSGNEKYCRSFLHLT
jgi:hypothetical protein